VCSAEVLACAWVQSPSSGLHHNTSAYASTTTAAALKKGHYYQQSPRPPLPRLPPLAALRSCHLGAGETKALSSGRGLFWARVVFFCSKPAASSSPLPASASCVCNPHSALQRMTQQRLYSSSWCSRLRLLSRGLSRCRSCPTVPGIVTCLTIHAPRLSLVAAPSLLSCRQRILWRTFPLNSSLRIQPVHSLPSNRLNHSSPCTSTSIFTSTSPSSAQTLSPSWPLTHLTSQARVPTKLSGRHILPKVFGVLPSKTSNSLCPHVPKSSSPQGVCSPHTSVAAMSTLSQPQTPAALDSPLREHRYRPVERLTDRLETPSLDDRSYRGQESCPRVSKSPAKMCANPLDSHPPPQPARGAPCSRCRN
jgi:hypothetical protein